MVAVIAQTALDIDSGKAEGIRPLRDREIEENLWRAIRYGTEGRLIDFRGGREVETVRALDDLLVWSSEARDGLGIEVDLPELNGARRARQLLASGSSIAEVYRQFTDEAGSSFGADTGDSPPA
jgi:carboxylate-amine ligase